MTPRARAARSTSPARSVAVLVAAAVLVVGCSSGSDGDHAGTTTPSRSTRSDPTPSKVTSTRPPAPPTTPELAATGLHGLEATYGCGPADGPWIDVRFTPDQDLSVVAELVLDGTVLSRSPRVEGKVGVLAITGFDPRLRSSADYGRTATVRIVDTVNADPPRAPRTETSVVLAMPEETFCG